MPDRVVFKLARSSPLQMQNLIENLIAGLRLNFEVPAQTIAREVECFLSLMLEEALTTFRQTIKLDHEYLHVEYLNQSFKLIYRRSAKTVYLQLTASSQGQILPYNEQFAELLLSTVSSHPKSPLISFLQPRGDGFQVTLQSTLLADPRQQNIQRLTQEMMAVIVELGRRMEKYCGNRNVFSQARRFGEKGRKGMLGKEGKEKKNLE